jgi:hypothetical protein
MGVNIGASAVGRGLSGQKESCSEVSRSKPLQQIERGDYDRDMENVTV